MVAEDHPMYSYPFGRKLKPVQPTPLRTQTVMVIGVYPSAVHARWVSPSGKTLIKAVAVDNEPEPFWDGTGESDFVNSVAKSVPAEAGRLETPVSGLNGPSGRVLSELYLAPLGLERELCWIVDIVDHYLINDQQVAALHRDYEPLVQSGILPE